MNNGYRTGEVRPMIDREPPNAAETRGASVGTRCGETSGAGSSPRRLACRPERAHRRLPEASNWGISGFAESERLVATRAYLPGEHSLSPAAVEANLNRGGQANLASLLEAPTAPSSRTGQRPTPDVRFARLPVAFEPNHGQTAAEVTYLARCRGYRVFLTPAGATVQFSSRGQVSRDESLDRGETCVLAQPRTISLRFLDGSAETAWEGSRTLPGVAHYLIGSDPTRWQRNIPTFAQVHWRGAYPGITVMYHGTPEGQLQIDFLAAPGADPAVIQFAVDGAAQVELTPLGDLTLQAGQQAVRLRKPVIYQETAGGRTPVEGGYVLTEDGTVRFTVGRYDAARTLVIDPVLVYSTYLGGSRSDYARSIAVDATGHAYIAGRTQSLDFPTQNPLQPSHGGRADDGFVAKLDPSGTALVYSTYLGGSSPDRCSAIALDTDGNVYVAGRTQSNDFPTTLAAVQGTHAGGTDAFVAKLNAAGSELVFSTFLGGSSLDHALDVAVDALGAVYVTGITTSADFPTLNPIQPNLAGEFDAFVTKLAADGQSLVFSTFLGGTADDGGESIAVDSDGAVYVAGHTESDDFPTVHALQPALGGGRDVFVAKLTPDGAALAYATYLGGSGYEPSSWDGEIHLVVDQGQAIVLTTTRSADFPTVNALQPVFGGSHDVALAKLAADGGSLIFSTYLGGPGHDVAQGLALDNQGNIVIAGDASAGFPTVNAIQENVGGGLDAFVSILTGDGSVLLFSTFLGGSELDSAFGVAVDPQGSIYVTGVTVSRDFPTTAGAFQETLEGANDAFVAKLNVQPDFRFEYVAKLLCGIQADPQDMRLAPGFYATTINIHNPHHAPVAPFKKLALTFPPGGQRPGQVLPIATDRLGPDEALAVDCVDIRNRLFPEGFPAPYVEGFVVIQSPESLDVTAVYTTAAVDERGNVTSHSSIHVEQVRERDRARVIEEATDLLIRKEAIIRAQDTTTIINDGIIRSSGTTAIVRYRIHVQNLGPATAQNVVVSDTLQVQPGTLLSVPEGAFSATHGGVWSLGQVTQSSAELEATIPVLLATEHAVLEFVVVVQVDLVASLRAELTNTASVTSDTVELDPSNNSVVVTTSLNP